MLTDDEILDEDGYPTEAALDHIRSFSGTPQELADFIAEIWWPQNPLGIDGPSVTYVFDGKRCEEFAQFELSTRGWSGNESVIDTLRDTKFWSRYWHMSVRGGGFEFRAGPKSWNEYDYLGENWWNHDNNS